MRPGRRCNVRKKPDSKPRQSGRPSAEISEQMSQALLSAAAAEFQESGFSGATMKRIAQRAGATRRTLYARFANKTELYEALVEALTSELLSLLSLVLDEQGTPQAVLEQFARQLLSAFVSSKLQRLHRMVIAEADRFPHLAATFYELGTERENNFCASIWKLR